MADECSNSTIRAAINATVCYSGNMRQSQDSAGRGSRVVRSGEQTLRPHLAAVAAALTTVTDWL